MSEPVRIHQDKDEVQQPEVHCPIDELVRDTLNRLLQTPESLEALFNEYMQVVKPAWSQTDSLEQNRTRLAMYARHLADHLFERIGTVVDDAITNALASNFDFPAEVQVEFAGAVLMADGTIGRQLDLGGGMFANVSMAEPGDNYDDEFNPLPGGSFTDEVDDEPEGPYKPRG